MLNSFWGSAMSTNMNTNYQDVERDALVYELRHCQCQEDYDDVLATLTTYDENNTMGTKRYCLKDVPELARRMTGHVEAHYGESLFDGIEICDCQDMGFAREWRKSKLINQVMQPYEKGNASYSAWMYLCLKRGNNTYAAACDIPIDELRGLVKPEDIEITDSEKKPWRANKRPRRRKVKLTVITTPKLTTRQIIENQIKEQYGKLSREYENVTRYTEAEFKRVCFHNIRRIEKR